MIGYEKPIIYLGGEYIGYRVKDNEKLAPDDNELCPMIKFGIFRDWKALETGHFRSLCFCSGSILVLLSGGIMWFCVFLMWKLTI